MTVIVSPSAHAHGEWIAAAAGGEVKYMYKNEDGHVLHMDVEVRPLPGCAERSSMLAVLGRRRISAATARVKLGRGTTSQRGFNSGQFGLLNAACMNLRYN